MSKPWSLRSDSPLSHHSRSASPHQSDEVYPNAPASETTPLTGRREKRGTYINLPVIVFIGFVFILLPIVFLMIWGPYLNSGIATERQKWERELRERRLQEQLREKEWEMELSERRLQERLREKEWEGQMRARELEERRKQVEWNSRQEREYQREEQWHRKEEERQRLGLHWAKPEANARCTTYNTRDYRARLLNTVPYHYNWLRPCQDIPIVIHDRNVTTTRCEIDQNGLGEVYGHWRIDFNEPACTPYWDQFKDKGCTAEGSHQRRIEAHLENVHWGEDGEKLCASTPHDFYGRHFDRPDSCANWGKYGIFGIWDIDDHNC